MEELEKITIDLQDEIDTLEKVKTTLVDAMKELENNTKYDDLIGYFENDITEMDNNIENNKKEIEDIQEQIEDIENGETYENWVKDRNREYERMV